MTTTHSWILFFTNLGRVYRTKGYELQEAGRDAKGQHLANLLEFQPDEHIAQVMDLKTYDQINVPAAVVGDAANYMLESQTATVALYEGTPLYVELPASVVLEITYTEPGLQGDRSTGGNKPATLETGYEIQVPLFLETGTKVKVDTRTGDYLGRVND